MGRAKCFWVVKALSKERNNEFASLTETSIYRWINRLRGPKGLYKETWKEITPTFKRGLRPRVSQDHTKERQINWNQSEREPKFNWNFRKMSILQVRETRTTSLFSRTDQFCKWERNYRRSITVQILPTPIYDWPQSGSVGNISFFWLKILKNANRIWSFV